MSRTGDASISALGQAVAPTITSTQSSNSNDIDIRNYKCIPLDILKNIGKDANNNDIITLTSDQPTLKSFKEKNEEVLRLSGPSGQSLLSADDIENLIVGILSAFLILFFLVIMFWGYLNLRSEGLAAFQLPRQLRTLPVLAFCSILFAVIGFLIGFFVKR